MHDEKALRNVSSFCCCWAWDCWTACCSACRSLRPTPLLFGSFGGWCSRSSGIDAGLLLRSQIARILVLRLLLGSLIVLWIYKEADLSGGSSCRGRRCLS